MLRFSGRFGEEWKPKKVGIASRECVGRLAGRSIGRLVSGFVSGSRSAVPSAGEMWFIFCE